MSALGAALARARNELLPSVQERWGNRGPPGGVGILALAGQGQDAHPFS